MRLSHVTESTGVKGAVDQALAWACIVLMAACVANVTWQVISRFVLGSPSSFTDELARFLLIWLGMLGAAYAVGQRMHLAIDLLPRALEPSARASAALGIVLQGCVLAFALGVMVYGGGQLVHLTTLLGQRSAALGAPLGAVYTVLPLAGAAIAFYAGAQGWEQVQVLRGVSSEAPRPGSGQKALTAANAPTRKPPSRKLPSGGAP
jgi:TRAP-type C4-dicarboxylate transport system permease small subunit